ncbi:MAG: hypothetical protein IKO19_01830 [Candidatus Riflebacteria bacterium]|nr:hypothetical protein [Candidatus Riflebacteria bacterium]MBR4569397.1 hypothetical protein [Candidatus Riflebacteria bacterium]
MKNKPTIAAAIILFLSLILSFYITVYDQELKKNKSDVEIFFPKEPVDIPKQLIEFKRNSLYKEFRSLMLNKLKNQRRFMYSLIDSYEYEISDFWKEVLNHFEIFEYYKAYPEAFIRRLILMPTFMGNKEFELDEDREDKLLVYPDYDYRSIRYRVSLVPDTIERAKRLVDYFYDRINISLGN